MTSSPHIVAGAYLLCPGPFNAEKEWTEEDAPDLFFHPEYRAGLRFGAVTLHSRMDESEIESAFEAIIQDVEGANGPGE